MALRLATLFSLFGLAGCSGPFLLLPGGALEGPTMATPSDWAFTDSISTVQLETRPEDPYSVNIWALDLDEYLYIHAGSKRAAWVENLEADPLARVRIDGGIYELTASRVEGEAEFSRFANAYAVKYGRRPRNENIAEIYLYRLGAR